MKQVYGTLFSKRLASFITFQDHNSFIIVYIKVTTNVRFLLSHDFSVTFDLPLFTISRRFSDIRSLFTISRGVSDIWSEVILD